MDKTVIPFDLYRMFVGGQSPWFLVEIVFRTLFIWGYTLALLRWIGHRAVGQLSLVEFLLVIALGSAVGDAMFYPEVPLTHALLVITVVVLADKGIDWLGARYRRFGEYLNGEPIRVVADGVLDLEAMRGANIPGGEVHEQLRLNGIGNLGEVERAYLETSGRLSVFRVPTGERRVGLPIVPPWETEPARVIAAGSRAGGPGFLACRRCGTVAHLADEELVRPCPRCDAREWVDTGASGHKRPVETP